MKRLPSSQRLGLVLLLVAFGVYVFIRIQ